MKMVPQFEVGDRVRVRRSPYYGLTGVVVSAAENGTNYVVKLEPDNKAYKSALTIHCFRHELQLREDQ
jgi:transcription antitermination factor NusG